MIASLPQRPAKKTAEYSLTTLSGPLEFLQTDALHLRRDPMKRTKTLMNGLAMSLTAIAMTAVCAAQNTTDGTATVVRIKGPARYTLGNNTWQALKVGTVLKPGSVVQTGTADGSFVDLVLGLGAVDVPSTGPAVFRPFIPSSMAFSGASEPSVSQNVVRVWQNSALGLDKLTTTQTGADSVNYTQLDLKMGHISGYVKKMPAASKYEIKLPNGVAGIRGTLYDIFAEGIVKVRVGSVVLAWVDPKTGNVVTQVVSGGQMYDARTGQVTPLSPADQQTLDSVNAGMRFVGPGTVTMLASDRTIHNASPVGPPFHPPGPPPVIPPRGQGGGPPPGHGP